MKKLLPFLSLIQALTYADLGDSRLTHPHYPSHWEVTHIYVKTGITVVANYGKRDGWFTGQEITEILKRNGMEPGV
jgi:hypothetical protein